VNVEVRHAAEDDPAKSDSLAVLRLEINRLRNQLQSYRNMVMAMQREKEELEEEVDRLTRGDVLGRPHGGVSEL
jgi:FtsZ-binding cell division protein ZapB